MRSPLAGKEAPKEILVDVVKLENDYYEKQPDVSDPQQLVSFGTSGHRGSSSSGSFTEAHILAITQAICDYRKKEGIDGPLYMGKDTHALSEPAERSALEVLAGNNVNVFMQKDNGFTPTPVISYSILSYNKGRKEGLADGIVITPSHNPPEDGGFKYNPPSGGPADTSITNWIQDRANEIIRESGKAVKRIPFESAIKSSSTKLYDFVQPYVEALESVVDMECIKGAGLKLGVDPMGGASVHYWGPISETWGVNVDVVNPQVDPQFSFMTVDHDGKIRMDCSSRDAMMKLIGLKDSYDIAFANDPDSDRHGIVTRSAGLMNPNHYLAVAIRYLFSNRPKWSRFVQVGKTLVSSGIIDKVATSLGVVVYEVPVGFKWFVEGLLRGTLGFGGEESAGASFLKQDGTAWSTDKDGLIMDLLAAEITAKTNRDPGEHFAEIEELFGRSYYKRLDQSATPEEKEAFKKMKPEAIKATELAGEQILSKLTKAPGNNEAIGGLKVITKNAWFAARPSGTENIYKIYAESFKGEEHLSQVIDEARSIVTQTISS
ncbi:MAG: alpha-D-glucose phosphate-specific phosphoglucomutase [SAR324 cluster bacterium]|uniref:Alpha-D-glucose phosphate-specific phosphoglucomutase n=1 Tax=SAR324 cluster bacterium TaxID=2024889 RepID=A0A7X9FT64_9DELT|nr:alpha-D-glucose phosphate-specific phosphoglucomutase [SAR324 cluster bacterium]